MIRYCVIVVDSLMRIISIVDGLRFRINLKKDERNGFEKYTYMQ